MATGIVPAGDRAGEGSEVYLLVEFLYKGRFGKEGARTLYSPTKMLGSNEFIERGD